MTYACSDGVLPTQPIEHLASFRAMPNILMLRPGDGTETAGAYKVRSSFPIAAWVLRGTNHMGPWF